MYLFADVRTMAGRVLNESQKENVPSEEKMIDEMRVRRYSTVSLSKARFKYINRKGDLS